MEPSKRQQAIFDCWEKEDKNILIRAVAGSGKTTTLMQLIERTKKKTLFLAFNKSIQMEIEERLNNKRITYARAMTLHSLGYKALRENMDCAIDKSKGFKIALEVQRKHSGDIWRLNFKEKQFLTATLCNMNDVSRMYLTDDMEEVHKHMKAMGSPIINFPPLTKLWDTFLRLREKSYDVSMVTIDYVDMIYLPLKKGYRIPTSPKYLMIDEAQDLNLAQHRLVDKILSQGAVEKWIAVGDSNQSIYGFSGAHSKSFDIFAEKDNVADLPLDICYRCPTLIVEEANMVYDVMEGYKSEEGVVSKCDLNDVATIPDGALVICRNTDPLIQLLFYMLAQDRKVFLKGDDILGTMEKFVRPYKDLHLATALSSMETEFLNYVAKFEDSKDSLDKYNMELFQTNKKNFSTIAKYYQFRVDKVSHMMQALKLLFKEDDNVDGVTLCTIHKSKGLEADVVYILNDFLMPSKNAHSEEALIQEENLKYVARTRAKKELYYLTINEGEI